MFLTETTDAISAQFLEATATNDGSLYVEFNNDDPAFSYSKKKVVKKATINNALNRCAGPPTYNPIQEIAYLIDVLTLSVVNLDTIAHTAVLVIEDVTGMGANTEIYRALIQPSEKLEWTPEGKWKIYDPSGVEKVICVSDVIGLIDSEIASSAGINTAETIITGGSASNQIKANTLKPGDVIEFFAAGTCTATVANTNTFKVRFGPNGTTADTAIAAFNADSSATSGTNIPFLLKIKITIRSVGSSGNIVGVMDIRNQSGATQSTASVGIIILAGQLYVASVSSVDTSVDSYFSLTYQSGGVTTTCTFTQAYIKKN